ncbi:MAG TPA: hypothetical protein VKB79_23975 [Bryobacteraceae bacterium]|nr:hypothetical protein [Bryobacteraceae bacterium]
MPQIYACVAWRVVVIAFALTWSLIGADHGPVFGLATPTNPKGGWSLDIGVNSRGGTGGLSSALEAELTYGITQNLKLAFSGPVVFQPDPYPRSSVTTNTPISGDFSGLAWYRFQKKDFAGKRVESTAVAGVLVPGPQQETGVFHGLNSGVGYLIGAVTGVASRSQYLWVGADYQRYAESRGDRRPDLFTYTAVYGYRPLSWRTDYPRWDWRIFGEFTGEHAGTLQRQMVAVAGSRANQLFLGPSVLGVYRAIGIEGGIQFPVYRDAGPLYPKERYRFALNFAYFF